VLIFARNAPKLLGGRAPPGPAGGAYSAPQTSYLNLGQPLRDGVGVGAKEMWGKGRKERGKGKERKINGGRERGGEGFAP